MNIGNYPEFYALCTQVNGQIQVRKLSFNRSVWYTVPQEQWPIDNHLIIDKYIQKKGLLKDHGRRTATVPLKGGTARTGGPTEAVKEYLDKDGHFKIGSQVLLVEEKKRENEDLDFVEADATANTILKLRE